MNICGWVWVHALLKNRLLWDDGTKLTKLARLSWEGHPPTCWICGQNNIVQTEQGKVFMAEQTPAVSSWLVNMLQQQVGIFCAWWYWVLTRKCPQFIGNRTETPSGKVILPDHSASEMPGCVTCSIWSPSACNYYYDPICPSRASSSVLFRSKQKMFKLKITLNFVCFQTSCP